MTCVMVLTTGWIIFDDVPNHSQKGFLQSYWYGLYGVMDILTKMFDFEPPNGLN